MRDIAVLPRYAALALVAPLVAGLILLCGYRHPLKLVWTPMFSLAVLLLFWSSLSYLWSVAPDSTIQGNIKLASVILLGFSAMQFATNTENAIRILAVSVIGGTLVSIIGLLQYLGHNPLGYMQYAPPASTFGNKNFAASYLDLIVPVAFILLYLAKRRLHVWLSAIMFGLCLAYLILIHSRASWLGLAAVTLVLFLLLLRQPALRKLFAERSRLRLAPLLVAFSIPFIMLILPAATENPAELLAAKRTMGLDMGMEIRLRAYANALSMIKEAPLNGFGLGSFMLAFRPFMFAAAPLTMANESLYLVYLHNDLLQIFVELGLVGGLLALALFALALSSAYRLATQQDASTVNLLGLGLLLSFIAFAVHALFSFPLQRPNSASQLWIWFGLSAGLSIHHGKTVRAFFLPGKIVPVLLAVMLSFLVFNGRYYYTSIKNSAHTKQMDIALREDRCDAAIEAALKIDPFRSYDSFILYPFAFLKCDVKADIALVPMNRILAYAPNNTLARLKRGYLFLETGKPDLAFEDFLVVVKILPHRSSGYQGIADTAATTGKTALAVKMYRKVLEIEPDNAAATQMLEKLTNLPEK